MKSYKIAGNAYFDADEAQAEIDALKAQNAELLAALESAEPHLLGYASKAVREAIAKARGDQV